MGGVTTYTYTYTYTYIYIYMCVCACACIDNAQLEKLKSRGPWPQHLNFSLCSSHCPFADFVCATGKNQETKGLDLVFQKLGTWKNTHGLGPGCCQLALRLTELLLRKPRSPQNKKLSPSISYFVAFSYMAKPYYALLKPGLRRAYDGLSKA